MVFALAPSLVQYRAEVNERWPQRDKTSDGWIGDTSHAARPSDHNPGARDLVHAFDTDEDLDGNPTNGYGDAFAIVNRIVANRDPRLKYLIYEARIMSGRLGPYPWVWRPYSGVNAHRHHVHLSILSTPEAEQDLRPWLVDRTPTVPPTLPPGDDDVIYELVKADGFTMMVLLSGGKQVRLNGETNKAAYKASDAYIGPVDEVSYGRLVTAYGQPVGA